ncbi:hypothetical protein ASPZODRAFT_149519 [Penicilliopsis zonata CBS 506.65]|uniref:Major facilitator superfamily (MFS) profile domain-containing protein n=1 Tax=Penicilliopsis zonata CBS 506.65 TaxID=1073090 RepID=A0A1L9SSC5_9EURO|nr:hypothetical protein ASPZODRAFT_149519 [Penicilliopsis zonata CBS 506.65]OJJ50112.1 hypothetical protein ASPZODRAFT_149519 [Penicilliopsis zonata CBS 506.65]
MNQFPPGTVRLEDRQNQHLILSPQPTSDPNEPLNWSASRKTVQMSLLCLYTIMCFAGLNVMTPVWEDLLEDRGFSFTLLDNTNATNFAALLVAGLAGAVSESLFQVTVADLFYVHQRGTMNGIYLVIVTIGNCLDPVASGYVAVSQGWQWSFWWCAIFMGITAVLLIFILEESKWKPSIHGIARLITRQPTRLVEIDHSIPMRSYLERHPFVQPAKVLKWSQFIMNYKEPVAILMEFAVVAFTAVQYGFNIACLAILVINQSTLYSESPYLFSTIQIGNMNLPTAIGSLLGALFGGPIIDLFLIRLAKRNGGIYEPEMRLYLYCIPALSMVAGIFFFGLTIAKGESWILNAVGAAFMGGGQGGMCDMLLAYLQDSYRDMTGAALVPVAFVCGTILVFPVPYWRSCMGTYNMFVLVGCLSVFVSSLHIPIAIFGKKSRIARAEKYAAYPKQHQ